MELEFNCSLPVSSLLVKSLNNIDSILMSIRSQVTIYHSGKYGSRDVYYYIVLVCWPNPSERILAVVGYQDYISTSPIMLFRNLVHDIVHQHKIAL
jgi:hypothetical protein